MVSMIETTTQLLLEQFTFWRIITVFITFNIIRIAIRYLHIWVFLQEAEKKHGAKTYFQFPMGFPHQLESDQNDAIKWHKQVSKENPKIRLLASHFGPTKLLQLVDPVLIKDFLTDQTRYKKSSLFDLFEDIVGKGLVFSNGKVWKKHRKLISETFRFDFIASQIPAISRVAKELFEKELSEAKGKQVDILDLYQRITGEIVFQIFFGGDLINANINGITPTKYLSNLCGLLFENVRAPENVFFGASGIKLKLFKRNRDLYQASNEFKQFIINIIEERKKKMNGVKTEILDGEGPKMMDFLDILLGSQKMSHGTEDAFTDEEVLHEFITFFIAGMDTTGHLLTMATHFYCNSTDEVKEVIMKEAESLAKNTGEITPEKLNKVEALAAFLKETLRKAGPTPVFFQREAIQDHYIGDVKVPKGAMVNCSFASNNFNPEYFKDPERFNHNRWIPGHEDYAVNAVKNSFIFTPFSAGSRNCIGQHLALMEAKIIFSIFITNFKFKVPEDYQMRMKMVFLYSPRDPFLIDVENRDENAPHNSFKCV